ncbi:MAG: CPBP family intramembrane metalloprotease [Anaerolineaceae bacterium]|nr:CPBP family intramembrane metalloprotease [Anaerolineaceae bacterium]
MKTIKRLLGPKIHFDQKVVLTTIISTSLIIVDQYHRITSSIFNSRVILFLLIPLFIIIFIFRESPTQYGFQLGDWKTGIALTIASIVIISPLIWFFSRQDFQLEGYYLRYLSPHIAWDMFRDLIGWEFLFRGWVLFSYARRYGPDALWLQAVPFAIAHIGKPEIETLSTIFGGFVFGWIAYRTRSFLYPFLIHWFIICLTILISTGIIR